MVQQFIDLTTKIKRKFILVGYVKFDAFTFVISGRKLNHRMLFTESGFNTNRLIRISILNIMHGLQREQNANGLIGKCIREEQAS